MQRKLFLHFVTGSLVPFLLIYKYCALAASYRHLASPLYQQMTKASETTAYSLVYSTNNALNEGMHCI